jgi:hypothetical protein
MWNALFRDMGICTPDEEVKNNPEEPDFIIHVKRLNIRCRFGDSRTENKVVEEMHGHGWCKFLTNTGTRFCGVTAPSLLSM